MQQLARFLAALLAILFTQAGYAASAQDDMRSLWESLWTQTGYPLPLSRWEVPAGSVLNFRFSGYFFNVFTPFSIRLGSKFQNTDKSNVFLIADVGKNNAWNTNFFTGYFFSNRIVRAVS